MELQAIASMTLCVEKEKHPELAFFSFFAIAYRRLLKNGCFESVTMSPSKRNTVDVPGLAEKNPIIELETVTDVSLFPCTKKVLRKRLSSYHVIFAPLYRRLRWLLRENYHDGSAINKTAGQKEEYPSS
ncbi:hypothetical protein NPIL_620831 [Nephila pilipes]|uniref:Uncharacterized protein n=1 Tax=Nephila pilipes TaxID=299642 RepID=A0A8X6MWM0_NEPPI|nr:hypothetical protein NPIL_620831 [Nephila pilipes]